MRAEKSEVTEIDGEAFLPLPEMILERAGLAVGDVVNAFVRDGALVIERSVKSDQ